MPRRKSVEKMSAEELYELARQREQEEAAKTQDAETDNAHAHATVDGNTGL